MVRTWAARAEALSGLDRHAEAAQVLTRVIELDANYEDVYLRRGMASLRGGQRPQAMADLPPQMRRGVELRVNQDLKYREIAVLMGVSIDTVKAHLFQARQMLKARLGNYFAEPRFADSNV